MTKSKTILAAAVLTALALTIAGLVAAPFNTSANAAAGQDIVADRIGAAFASIPDLAPDAAIEAAAVRVAKGDLLARPGCAGAIWPNISAECLATADGSPAPQVRTITVGYQEGQSTTVLMRVPTLEVASR